MVRSLEGGTLQMTAHKRRWNRGQWWMVLSRYWRGLAGLFSVRMAVPVSDFLVVTILAAPGGVIWYENVPTCCARLGALLVGGVIALLLHAASWALFEVWIKSAYHAGGYQQPEGWDAIWFGVTMSLALAVAPHLGHRCMGTPVLPMNHWRVWSLTALIATIAYLSVYGWSKRRFKGLRRTVLDWRSAATKSWERLFIKEVIVLFFYTVSISALTVAPYRYMTALSQTPTDLIGSILISAGVPFFGGTFYMLLDRQAALPGAGGERRGLLVAALLMPSLFVTIYW